MRHLFMLMVLVGLVAVDTRAQNQQTDWNKPFPPHKVIGNVYYVGSEQLASFLITTPDGHILVNSSFETTVPVIRAAVEKLGFKFTDIKILLGSHAHGDHMQGDALIKELTGAQVMAMEQDVPALRSMRSGGKEHPIDRVLKDGDEVKLGGTTLVAHLTAGHTKGCTTWTLRVQDGAMPYNVAILGSIGVNPGYVLVNNKDYPDIAADYVKSFKTLRSLPVDVFLGAHGSFYGMTDKYAQLGKASRNPFIDPDGFKAHLDRQEKNFQARLDEQKNAATK
ncbi:MAG TPA: subclass B3 metallo-beta-lactamase [Vicinamibacterales bacterium]|nr:subclass B3 metallo-beta-lactamase [Vicinamibacterales bacterium]